MPAWAKGAVDARDMLRWDSDQYVAPVLVDKILVLCVVDTGSCMTIMDTAMARALHLVVHAAKGPEFGCYLVPGAQSSCPYFGIVEGPVALRVADGVVLTLRHVRVVE